MQTIDRVAGSALRALRPPPRLPLDKWIESTIRLPAGVSAIPGRVVLWPYMREVAAAIGDPFIERVTLLKPVRVGFTTLLTASVGHYARNEPSPILVVLPTEDDARSYLADEIEPIFAATPDLAFTLSENRGGRDTMLARRFAGGSLRLVPSKSQRNLRRLTAKIILIDEADAMDAGAEGDPITLAEKRALTFPDRKIVLGSSPILTVTSRVLRAYGLSDARVYECPCPECGAFSEILWKHIVWPEGEPGKAVFECPHCDARIDEKHKPAMVEDGAWRATRPEIEGHAGFRLNSLISGLRNASWGRLAAEFLEAKKNPDTLQTFVNTILAEGWDGGGSEIDYTALASRAEPFGLDDIPAEVLWLVAGADVQKDRIEVGFYGFDRAGTIIFALDQAVVWGDPQTGETWSELDDLLRRDYLHPLGGRIGLDAVGIDAGDGNTTEAVTAFTQPRHARRIFALKGAPGARPAIVSSRTANRRRLFICGVDGIKARIMSTLESGTGFRFSNTLEGRYFEELTAERRHVRYRRGVPVATWERRPGMRAEALDCAVYALAVRELLKGDPDRREAELRQTPEAAPKRSRRTRSRFIAGRA